MLTKIATFLVATLCWISVYAHAAITDGITAYDHGDFAKAAETLRAAAVEQGDNGHLYYNLGNAYMRKGEVGQAMAALLAARRLLPRDPDIQANLAFVHKGIPDRLDVSLPKSVMTMLSFWLTNTTPKEVAYFALTLWVLGFLLLLPARTFPQLRVAGISALVLAMLSGAAFSLSIYNDHPWGAVIQPKANIFSGPGIHNAIIFELKEGAPFAVGQTGDQWYQIELSDGKKGWISRTDCQVYIY